MAYKYPLVCKMCGYKQYDLDTIKAMRKTFPKMETYDIPYYCAACQDNVDDETYYEMQAEMGNRKNK